MTKTFAALKTEALAATNPVDLYRIASESAEKLRRNVAKAQFMSYTPGRSADADHYFQNVIPGWTTINNEINALWRAAADKMSKRDLLETILTASDVSAEKRAELLEGAE